MEILKDISIFWSLLHTLVLFLLLFESRYGEKKTLILTAATMAPLIAVNILLFLFFGSETFSLLMLLTLSLPSCIIFWFLSKRRDGRFFFTFCMVDTTVLEIIYITNILNHYITPDTYVFMFTVRLLVFPLMEIWVVKRLRPVFIEVQREVRRGWGHFAFIGALFYVAITLLMSVPSPITERPIYIPAVALLFLLMPIIYMHIISTLRHQQKAYHREEQEHILKHQVSSLTARMDELSAADDRFRMERHNLRHKLKTISSLIKAEEYDECITLLSEYEDALETTKVKRYCQHTVLDAVLSSYIRRAENKDIRVDLGLAFPEDLPVSETELATAIANALENAINACEKLPAEKRFIDLKVLSHPRFMLRIANSFEGEVEFDAENIPVNHDHDHGFGTRFIAAFCKKNNGFYEFTAENEVFTLYLNF